MISDASWGECVRQLEYKSSWYGTRVKKIGRFEPSSKTCQRCAYVKTDLTLEERAWDCPKCGSHLDRDLNAAMNIVAFSKKPPMDSRGVSLEDTKPVESSAIAGTVKQENL
ncbi:MAG: transposase, partial [Treponema sp.]|nr:transposase [Treponema sp.]